MFPYPKIQSIYKRDEKTHKFLEDNGLFPSLNISLTINGSGLKKSTDVYIIQMKLLRIED